MSLNRPHRPAPHINGVALAATLVMLLVLCANGEAAVVSQSDYVKTALIKKTLLQRKHRQRSHIEVLLDLSGYRNAAVAFNFATLMRQDADGFKLMSSKTDRYRNDFRLISPIRTRWERGLNGMFHRATPTGNGFTTGRSGRRYEAAMFNLAAYDGQTVMLTLEFDKRAARRRGVININHLRVAVQSSPDGPAGASIPEPGTTVLLIAGGLALLLAPRTARSRRSALQPA